MTKRPFGHGDIRNMGNFKANAADYAYYLSLSDEGRLYCLTDRQVYALQVQLDYIGWMTRWYNTEDTSAPELATIPAGNEDLLMCGCGVPTPSVTDYVNSITYNNSTTTVYETTENTWNTGGQTVVSIAPNLDYDTGDPVDISKLVCFAMEALIRSIISQAKQINNGEAEDSIDLTNELSAAFVGLSAAGGIAIGIGGVAAAVVGFFGGPWMLLGLALAGFGTRIATLFMGADNSLFENTAAIDHVICVAQTKINGVQVTREVFQGALTPLGYAPETPEGQLAAIIQPFLDDLTIYLQFLSLGNTLYEAVDFAILPDCGCDVPPDPECIDVTEDGTSWVASPDSAFAAWVDGEGWGPGSGGGGTYFNINHVTTPSGLINRIHIIFNMPQDNLYLAITGVGVYYASGSVSEIDINSVDNPALLPFDGAVHVMTLSRTGNVVDPAFRVIMDCIYFEP